MEKQWQQFLDDNQTNWSYGIVPSLVDKLDKAENAQAFAEIENTLLTQGICIDKNGNLNFIAREIFTAAEVADALNISRPAVSYHVKKGNLKIKDGGITAQSVEYLKNNKGKGGRPLGSFKNR